MSDYKCLACGVIFCAPTNTDYVRHEKYGGCTWGIGSKIKHKPKPNKRAEEFAEWIVKSFDDAKEER